MSSEHSRLHWLVRPHTTLGSDIVELVVQRFSFPFVDDLLRISGRHILLDVNVLNPFDFQLYIVCSNSLSILDRERLLV